MIQPFTSWFDLNHHSISLHAPTDPCALQVRRASGLVDYPTGKSAMVWYGYADNPRRALIARFADLGDEWHHPQYGPLRFRYLKGGQDVRHTIEGLANKFHRRFGRLPILMADPAP